MGTPFKLLPLNHSALLSDHPVLQQYLPVRIVHGSDIRESKNHEI